MTTRREWIAALQLLYGSAVFTDQIKILGNFVALTCSCPPQPDFRNSQVLPLVPSSAKNNACRRQCHAWPT
jgi:hypothetical protein